MPRRPDSALLKYVRDHGEFLTEYPPAYRRQLRRFRRWFSFKRADLTDVDADDEEAVRVRMSPYGRRQLAQESKSGETLTKAEEAWLSAFKRIMHRQRGRLDVEIDENKVTILLNGKMHYLFRKP